MPSVIWKNEARTEIVFNPDWKPSDGLRLHLLITQDPTGIISAVVLNLPGTGSCGETEEEAISNAKEAARSAVEVYREFGEEVPWKDTSRTEIPAGAKQKWIILDA